MAILGSGSETEVDRDSGFIESRTGSRMIATGQRDQMDRCYSGSDRTARREEETDGEEREREWPHCTWLAAFNFWFFGITTT